MRFHFYLAGLLAAAAGTLAKKAPPPPCSTQRNAIRYDDSLQYLTDVMNLMGAEIASLNYEFNNWNGDNKKHIAQIVGIQANIICWATVAVEAYNDVEFTPKLLTPEQQKGLPTAPLFQNIVAYADLMKRQDSRDKWTKWRGKKDTPTARQWLDSSKQSLDAFLFTFVGKIGKDRWDDFKTGYVEGYDTAFKLSRDLYPQ